MPCVYYDDPGLDSFGRRNNQEEHAFRVVGFTIADDPTKLVGHEFSDYTQLTSHVPFSRVFTSNDQIWAQRLTEEMADQFVSFRLCVSKKIAQTAFDGCKIAYDLSSRYPIFSDIERTYSRIASREDSKLLKELPWVDDIGKLLTTKAQHVGETVMINNFSLVIFSTSRPKSAVKIKEVTSLGSGYETAA